MNRRDLLKYSSLIGANLFLHPNLLWSNSIKESTKTNKKFIFSNKNNREFSPNIIPDLSSLKARLHWNENPFGPSKAALKEFKNSAKKGNFYSWDRHNEFIDVISSKEGVNPGNILTGPGSSDLLEKVAIVLLRNGGSVISADPCYMSLINVAIAINANSHLVKLTPEYEHDLDAMESKINSETKLIYITNPNNPTATITDRKKLYAFCDRVSKRVPVFIDEAYIEVSEGGLENSMVKLVSQGKDIIISRTFSKIYGMAGLRLGYIVAAEKRLEEIRSITRGGMGITGPSINAAIKSLDDFDFINSCKENFIFNREFTVSQLKNRGFNPMPSNTNFLIFELPNSTSPNLFLKKMYQQRVSVKSFNFWEKNWCRVSIGTMDDMKTFIDAFDNALI